MADIPPRPKPAVRGQPAVITARMWNALTDLVYKQNRFGTGIAGENGFASTRSVISKRREIDVAALEDLAANSIFGITSGQAYDDQPIATVARVGPAYVGSSLTLFTNPTELFGGYKGKAHPIDFWSPTLVRYSGAAPGIGQPCGFEPNSLAVSASYWGYECVSAPNDGRIWIVGSSVASVCGMVLSEVEAFDPVNRVLGAGTMRIEYRINGSNQLQRAYNPTTQTRPWVVTIYNNCNVAVPFGEIVVARNVLGVGLVVDPCAVPGSLSSSSEPSTSSSTESSPSESSPSESSPSESSPSGSSESSPSESSPSGSSESSSAECITISGINLAELPVADPANIDGLLAVQDGCLVIVPVAECNGDMSSSS